MNPPSFSDTISYTNLFYLESRDGTVGKDRNEKTAELVRTEIKQNMYGEWYPNFQDIKVPGTRLHQTRNCLDFWGFQFIDKFLTKPRYNNATRVLLYKSLVLTKFSSVCIIATFRSYLCIIDVSTSDITPITPKTRDAHNRVI
jgi:hypothetical protein